MDDLKRRILVLDDDPEVRVTFSDVLIEEGFEVQTAGTIAEFQVISRARKFDLFLLDVGLPDGSGLSLLKPLREETEAGVILLAPRRDRIDEVVGPEQGAHDYVGKSCPLPELVARIHAVLRRISPRGAPAMAGPDVSLPVDFQFDGYRVCLSARRVLAPDGSDVALTRAEFEILGVFLKCQGCILTRDQLMRTVRGRDRESHDRAVDTLVSKLRRKLPPQEGRTIPYIRTVHGLGYEFMG
ncbi:response regulator transcription factor [Neotabrizicola shimadae]|uniref:Response regulator transcription factor n=1 Tax=Neotabrizicola shimadae TaxID=2807096 RepID=A0A8G0ZQY6_9RHOB|nr:response regulator transcription factor [Neotabrizicola shimadae]QYZ69826.1 response regulator transcription factor [Neotabrizicola shimadae]